VVEGQTELIVRFLADSTITFVNEAFYKFFSTTRQEILGKSILKIGLLHEGDAHLILHALENLQNNSTIDLNKPYQTRVILANGETRWLESITSAVCTPDGVFAEFQAVARDVTDLKRMEAALRESEERYRSVVEGQTEFIIRIKPDSTISFVNEALCRFYSKSRQEMLGDLLSICSLNQRGQDWKRTGRL